MSEEKTDCAQATPPEEAMKKKADEESEEELSADVNYYHYEKLHSKPFITPGSDIPEHLLHFSHSFGYDSGRRGNLQLLDDRTLMFVAGNLLILLDISSKEQRYLRSCSGGGIGSIAAHPSKEYFALAEKGIQPNIIIYQYPSLQLHCILRGGTARAYSFVDFNKDGSLLAGVGSDPDYMLTLWDWRREEVILSCKATSQEVYRVSFSPYNPELLTSSGSHHIKFWKMASTVTGLKLRGLMGHFGKTAATDIEGYVELPDGKVVSGSDWGNLLMWDGNAIKVEICRKEGRNCHAGKVQPFALEDGQLLTFGSDGVVRSWDFEGIDTASSNGNSNKFEMEPMDEIVVGRDVCLSSMVKSSTHGSFVWFAQDSSGAIWKLDLSFTNATLDPQCLFSSHAGPIQGLDVSRKSHLMATTALDGSIKVFDFLAKRELTTTRFNQGGTALSWAPTVVNQSGGLMVTGFEDGVVRLLELFNPQRLHLTSGRSPKGDAELRLKHAFKPHDASVTAVAFDRNGEILATGSSGCTVFFFTVSKRFNPVGFIHVPGPVQALEWSPHAHSDSRLLILCRSGHVVEVQSPDAEAQESADTFHLPDVPRKVFKFRSIKSRIKREEEISRCQEIKKRKERGEMLEESEHPDLKSEEELPPIYIPDPSSPLCCGFYSLPGQFWLSMGGYDAGFLYHCKFSENQDQKLDQRQDEPFAFLPIHNADEDPICSITFSSDRQLLLCGMHSGSLRVYPLQPGDHSLTSMQAYWSLSLHDNHYGHLSHIRCSHDDQFVLTAGDDGNIFSFTRIPPEDLQKGLQRQRAKVPSPRKALEHEALAQDIEDPAAYSIETAKQKLEKDRLYREAELKKAAKRKKLAELQKKYQEVLDVNQSLPEHVRLTPEELQLDPRFSEEMERVKALRVRAVREQMSWELEHCNIALSKLQNWFENSPEFSVITVVAINSEHRISTYCLPTLTKTLIQLSHQSTVSQPEEDGAALRGHRESRAEPPKDENKLEEEPEEDGAAARGHRESRTEPPKNGNKLEEEVIPCRPVARSSGIKLTARQIERLQKAEEQAKKARAKIEKRKQEWAQLYAEKPDKNYEDPKDMQAIKEARENIGDLKLKSERTDYLRVTAEEKRAELMSLEDRVRLKKTEMNKQITALRDSKVLLVSQLCVKTERVKTIQQCLPAHLHRPTPTLPSILPEETPEKKLQYGKATLERYRLLRDHSLKTTGQEADTSVLVQLEKLEKEEKEEEETPVLSDLSRSREAEELTGEEGAELSELEEELQREQEIRLQYEQDSLLKEMETLLCQFDAELRLLLHQKLLLDQRLKMADSSQLILYQELLVLKEFEKKENSLQEKLNTCIKEENSISSKLEEFNEQLESKRADIGRLQKREKDLFEAFQASLGQNNKFKEFLTKVFKKKIKPVRRESEEEEEESDEDSDEDFGSDDDTESDSEEGGALDTDVCPAGCEPELFEYTLQLRERRLEVEKLLVEEKKSAKALMVECDTLTKKEMFMKSSRTAAEEALELVYREKQDKMNKLDLRVAVPLRLSQIECFDNDSMQPDLNNALLLDRTELNRLHERVNQLNVETSQQKDLCCAVHQEHARLLHDCKEMKTKVQVLDRECNEIMMKKFGRPVDLEALQTLSGNRRVEELKQEKLLKEAAHAKEIREWDRKVEEARDNLNEVTRRHSEVLHCMTALVNEKRELDKKLNARQKKMRGPLQISRRREVQEDIQHLKELIKKQSQEAEALSREIFLLSRQGGHVTLPPIDLSRSPQRPHHSRSHLTKDRCQKKHKAL